MTFPPGRESIRMHLITAIIKPHRLEAVTEALKERGIGGLTVSEVQGFGRQGGHSEVYRGSEYHVDYLPKVRVEVICADADSDAIATLIADTARTGKIGDGKIWITELAGVLRIRTGEIGPDAL
jgi:nitrogen regulatory protein P-II 1